MKSWKLRTCCFTRSGTTAIWTCGGKSNTERSGLRITTRGLPMEAITRNTSLIVPTKVQSVLPPRRATIWAEELRSMDGFRVGNAEQQALGAAVGLARGLGHARYVVEGGFKLGDGKRALVPQPRKSA